MNEQEMCYLAGVKIGIENLVKSLSDVAEKNGNQLPIEFINYVANNVVSDIETQLESMERGDKLVDMLNGKLQKERGIKMEVTKIICDCCGEEIPKVKKKDIFGIEREYYRMGKMKLWRTIYRHKLSKFRIGFMRDVLEKSV